MTQSEHPPSKAGADRPASIGQILTEYARTIITVAIVVTFVRTFLFESFVIPSGSMIPSLQVGDYIWVSKYTYGYSKYSLPFSPNLFEGRVWGAEPQRGDVAVFRFTKDPSIDYVKRVIGLPGDHIRVTAGHLFLNGEQVPCLDVHPYTAVDEAHVAMEGEACQEVLPGSGGKTEVKHAMLKLMDDGQQNNTPEYVVPPGYFFAMGDNRDDSADSRFMGDGPKDLGFVPMQNLVGKAKIVFFSTDSTAPFWQFWHWPAEIRWGRLFRSVT